MGRYEDDIYISWDELHRDSRKLCRELLALDQTWDRLVAVTRGGLIPAAIVARMIASGRLRRPGVHAPEVLATVDGVVEELLVEHTHRGVTYRFQECSA